MVISAYSLTTYQSCKRRRLLEEHWRVIRWHPKALFDSCLRMAVASISGGQDVEEVIAEARTQFMSQAANPGLSDVRGDPYTVASDWCAMLGTVLAALSRGTLFRMRRPEPVAIEPGSGLVWHPSCFEDDSKVLHRWITVDAWDSAEISRQLHSWYVFGDLCIYDAPMTLHVIEIGQQRGPRRSSPWCRTFKHPVIAHKYKFQRSGGRKLSGTEWKPVWLADLHDTSSEAWVDLMDQEGVTPTLLHQASIRVPSTAARLEGLRHIREESARVADLVTDSTPVAGLSQPMSRAACDGGASGRACPWQDACFVPDPGRGDEFRRLEDLGLYQLRRERAAPASGRSGQLLHILPASE